MRSFCADDSQIPTPSPDFLHKFQSHISNRLQDVAAQSQLSSQFPMCKQNLTLPPKFHFFPNSSSLSNEPVILILLAESSRKTWSPPSSAPDAKVYEGFLSQRQKREFFLCYFNFPNLPYPTTPDDWLQSLHTNPDYILLLIQFLKNYSHQNYEWLPTSCYERVKNLLSFQGPPVMSWLHPLHPTVLSNIKSLIQTKMS